MKTIKSFITLLLLMVCAAVEAQTVVVVEKTDGTKDEYPIAEVDSVVYKPVYPYFYYAGWTLPTSEEDLAKNGTEIGSSIEEYTKSDPLLDAYGTENQITNPDGVKAQYYIVLPTTAKPSGVALSVYDDDGDVTSTQYYEVTDTTISGYKILKSGASVKYIKGIYIY